MPVICRVVAGSGSRTGRTNPIWEKSLIQKEITYLAILGVGYIKYYDNFFQQIFMYEISLKWGKWYGRITLHALEYMSGRCWKRWGQAFIDTFTFQGAILNRDLAIATIFKASHTCWSEQGSQHAYVRLGLYGCGKTDRIKAWFFFIYNSACKSHSTWYFLQIGRYIFHNPSTISR